MNIELKNVSKSFKKNEVLKDINLTLKEGTIYGFVGRNGSGKTVLLKLICGYFEPTTGEILFNGKILNKELKYPLSTRALIESPRFLPMLTGYQNLELLANIQKIIGKEEIEKTLKDVNLYEAKDKKYHTYSLGMKQKLGIAQVLMENPSVIILDEPFNGVEKESADKIRKLLLEEKNKGKTILIATHIKEDIESLCEEIYEVENGNIKKTINNFCQ